MSDKDSIPDAREASNMALLGALEDVKGCVTPVTLVTAFSASCNTFMRCCLAHSSTRDPSMEVLEDFGIEQSVTDTFHETMKDNAMRENDA